MSPKIEMVPGFSPRPAQLPLAGDAAVVSKLDEVAGELREDNARLRDTIRLLSRGQQALADLKATEVGRYRVTTEMFTAYAGALICWLLGTILDWEVLKAIGTLVMLGVLAIWAARTYRFIGVLGWRRARVAAYGRIAERAVEEMMASESAS